MLIIILGSSFYTNWVDRVLNI